MFSDVVNMAPRPMVGQSTNTGATSRTHPPNRGATTGADNPTGLVIGFPFLVGGSPIMTGAGATLPRWRRIDSGRGHIMSTEYGIGISFFTDRELTEEELDHLLNAVAVQVEDPSGLNGDKRATFTVSDCAYDVFHINKADEDGNQ